MHRIQCCYLFFCNVIKEYWTILVIRVYNTSYSRRSWFVEFLSFILQASVFLSLAYVCPPFFILFTFLSTFFSSCFLSTMPSFTLPAGLLFLLLISFLCAFLLIAFSLVSYAYAAFSPPFFSPFNSSFSYQGIREDIKPPAAFSASSSIPFSSISPSHKGLSEDGRSCEAGCWF